MNKLYAVVLTVMMLFPGLISHAQKLRVVFTTDVHGAILGWDFVNHKPMRGGLPSLYSYLKEMPDHQRQNTIILDGGDILQGQVSVSYYNQHPDKKPHIVAQAMNLIGYDAACVGNHDIEAGSAVYQSITKEFNFPWLAANVIDQRNERPFFQPYTIIHKNNLKVAVLGLTSPGVPSWLSPKLWDGLYFGDMIDQAHYWVKYIQDHEDPDVMIGLFHAGFDSEQSRLEDGDPIRFDPVEAIAKYVDGFDLILYGHDHRRNYTQVMNPSHKPVLLANPGPKGLAVCDLEFDLARDSVSVQTQHVALINYPRSEEFLSHFKSQVELLADYAQTPICRLKTPVNAEDALFGPSLFVDVLHQMQMEMSGAQISLVAPFRLDVNIDTGLIYLKDLYDLYHYENFMSVLYLTGGELRRFLEYSYDLWIQTMKTPSDDMLRYANQQGEPHRLMHPFFNFDAAAGIRYHVDLKKPYGQRVRILSLDDERRTPFDTVKYYQIVTNSYRSSGGGGHLGAIGLNDSTIRSRITYESDQMVRQLLFEWLSKQGDFTPHELKNWQFVPKDWAEPAIRNARKKLFSEDTLNLSVIEITDIHANYFDWDPIRRRPAMGGLPYAYSYIENLRDSIKNPVLLLHGGDYIQGQLASYYYNFVDQRPFYFPSLLLNRLRVDASVIGNHDIEQGRFMMERYSEHLKSPIVAANLIDNITGKPYFQPYTCIYKEGVKIAVLGLTIPLMSQCHYSDPGDRLHIDDMLESARYWVSYIQEMESPDLLFGLFHASFTDQDEAWDCLRRNSAKTIAIEVPGFDALFLGHEHKNILQRVANVLGDSVWLVEPGYGGRHLARIDYQYVKDANAFKVIHSHAQIVNATDTEIRPDIHHFLKKEQQLIVQISEDTLATLLDTFSTYDAYFGPSAIIDWVHDIQLAYSGAQISFSSPLSSNVVMTPGPILFSDLFRLYRYENNIVKIWMSGQEIIQYLEYAYQQWVHTMKGPADQFLRLRPFDSNEQSIPEFEIPQYNFDSGRGLRYSVDVSRPYGERILIQSLADGRRFCVDSLYTVVLSEHRFKGHGGHFEYGAHIPQKDLPKRLLERYPVQVRDLHYEYLKRYGRLSAPSDPQWSFIPETWVKAAKQRERPLFD